MSFSWAFFCYEENCIRAHMSQKPPLLPAWAQPLTVTVRIMVPRIQELDWPWDSRKAVTLSRRGVTPQLAKEYRDMRSTQVSVSSWWKVSSACRWSDSCSEYCCCCPRSDSTDFLLHHEVGLFKLLLNINSKILNLHATKSFLWVSLHLRNHMMMTWRARETV